MKHFIFCLLLLIASPTQADELSDFLASIETQVTQVDDLKYYENKSFVHEITKEKTKFSNFNLVEKKLFCVWKTDVLSKRLLAYEMALKGEPAITIKAWRKTLAIKQEALISRVFAEIGDDIIPATDKMSYLKTVQRWNSEQQLISRESK